MAGQSAKCPTCGVSFVVPDRATLAARRGEVLKVGQLPDERMGVHAYAAAGDMAPEVVTDVSGRSMIRCRRCGTMNKIDAESCRSCGIPFTMEAGTGILADRWSGWTVASLLLGMLSIAAYTMPLVAIAAVVAGLVATKRLYVQYNSAQWLAAWSGVVLGMLALVSFSVGYITGHW